MIGEDEDGKEMRDVRLKEGMNDKR